MMREKRPIGRIVKLLPRLSFGPSAGVKGNYEVEAVSQSTAKRAGVNCSTEQQG